MKFCSIPPIPNLRSFESTGMHLCLAHLIADSEYVKYYRERADAGDYIILDNGAHEDEKFEMSQLLALGRIIGAKEVVIPDTPHNAILTIESFTNCLNYLEADPFMKSFYLECGAPRLMYVPQVPLMGDCFTRFIDLSGYMFRQALETKNKELTFTVGIPLMYDDHAVSGGLYSILDRITWLVEDSGVDVHLLGWSRDLTTPVDIAHDYPGVRSCDSAKPFVFAKHGIDMKRAALQNALEDLYPGRSETYFTEELSEQEIKLAKHNVDFCVRALEFGDLPSLSELTDSMSEEDREDEPSTRS
jgi:hypothetical protein